MSHRDTLTPEQQVIYDQAITAAAMVLGRARSRRDSLSPEDAAREAYVPGGPSIEEITELIKKHRTEARAAMDTGMAGAA